MIILGIDPGLANTGWGVIETRGSATRCRAYGCIRTGADEEITARLKCIHDEVEAAIEKYGPDAVAIEQIYFGANSKSALATGQARGAALVACARSGLDVGEYTPMQIKQAVVGTGAADKAQVQYMVRSLLTLDHTPKPDHAADALAAAICFAHLVRYERISASVSETVASEEAR